MRISSKHATFHHCARGCIQGVSNKISLGALVCHDRVHIGTNGKVEDMESRDGEEMPAGEHEEDKDHGPWSQSGPSDLPSNPDLKSFSKNVLLL